MLTTNVTIPPIVEGACPACGHRATRRAERYQTVYWTTKAVEFYDRPASDVSWYLARCRCGHEWLSLPAGATVGVENA